MKHLAYLTFSADAPGRYSGGIVIEDAHKAQTVAGGAQLTAAGVLDNGQQYESQLRVLAVGGEVTSKDGALQFKNCDELVLVLAADTNYVMDAAKGWKGGHPHKRVTKRVDSISAGDYARLLQEHVADHRSLFNRVELDLGPTDPAQASLPTDKRLEARRQGAADPDLTEILFQHGRYLMIACSRPGSLPANLQGLWNHSNTPEYVFLFFCGMMVLQLVWVATMVPKKKGVSLEQMQQRLGIE
jgi:alpha-L-fucosidase 2